MIIIFFVRKSAFEQTSAEKADLYSVSYYLEQLYGGPEDPFPRWLFPMAGKWVLAVRYHSARG